MTKKEEFINWVEEIMKAAKTDWHEAPDNVQMYWEAFKGKNDSEKPAFTDNGKLILKYLQDNQDTPIPYIVLAFLLPHPYDGHKSVHLPQHE